MYIIIIVVFEPECDQTFCSLVENKAITKKEKKIRTQIFQLTLCIHRRFEKKKFTDMPPLNSISDKPYCPKLHESLIINYAEHMKTL